MEPYELKWEDNDQAHLGTGREGGRATLALAEPRQRLTRRLPMPPGRQTPRTARA